MKKFILVLLSSITMNVSAEMSTTQIGKLTDFVGNKVVIVVADSGRDKTIYIMTRGRYNIRKATLGLTVVEARELKRLIDEAILKAK